MKSIILLVVILCPGYLNGFRVVNDTISYNFPLFFDTPNLTTPSYNQTRKKPFTRTKTTGLCGIDNSPVLPVYEGTGNIETYPWLGVLYYPKGRFRFVTTVVLVAKGLVIGSAIDIHKLPKTDFRSQAKVVLGQNCSQPGLRIREYNYHPHYRTKTSSALVLIQLDLRNFTELVGVVLHPICAPPPVIKKDTIFYAMVLNDSCRNSKIKIYEMDSVSKDHCKQFYRRSGLSIESIWPTYTACGRARTGGDCIWRDGAVLAVKQQGAWHLLGFGVHGPGCEAPSRFIDYTRHIKWVRNTIARTGQPAVTQVDDNYVILRRSDGSIQRYGHCDVEELFAELYTDRTEYRSNQKNTQGLVRFNMSVYSNIDYSCVYFIAMYPKKMLIEEKPRVRLSYSCGFAPQLCWQPNMQQVDFFVQIEFKTVCVFKMAVYGRDKRMVTVKDVVKYYNNELPDNYIQLPWKLRK